ncbi:MAG: hypothetical protein Q7S83_01560 [bacterium]|nr:hypothetical protein [bacterium]
MNKKIIIAVAVLSLGAVASLAGATHSWGGYHWARTANPFTVKLGDNLASAWDPYLGTTSYDWTLSSVLDTSVVPGTVNPRTCKAMPGMVEVCNSKYGKNGWLGIASVWVSGSHITQSTVKVNDTYFSTAKYNTPAWKNLVMCQEVGHAFGLDHQDEDFNNPALGTCMDYTSDPTPNQHPNQHDYDMLEAIYAHLDTSTTLSQSSTASAGQDIDHNNPKAWGKVLRTSSDKKASVHELDLGKDKKVFTFVIWAE